MPRVRMMTSIATTGRNYRRGEEADLDAATAQAWVSAGQAVPVGVQDQAVAETTARRTGRTGQGRGGRRKGGEGAGPDAG